MKTEKFESKWVEMGQGRKYQYLEFKWQGWDYLWLPRGHQQYLLSLVSVFLHKGANSINQEICS
jgi:hypothetical protein